MIPEHTKADSFTEFVAESEERLRIALTATHGPDRGREATAEALAYGWENWDRIRSLENPAGYLYRVGHNKARRIRRPIMRLPLVEVGREPWIEPGLPSALEQLPERQRTVVALLHGMQWSMSEVAEQLGISKATVQKHADRGLAKLRKKLGVNL